MMTANTSNRVKYEWKRNRSAFLAAAVKVILEADIPRSRFWDECKAMYKIAKETDIKVTIYGNPTEKQIRNADNRCYGQFERDLKNRVFDRMPSDPTVDYLY
jgi:hypothetical protein